MTTPARTPVPGRNRFSRGPETGRTAAAEPGARRPPGSGRPPAAASPLAPAVKIVGGARKKKPWRRARGNPNRVRLPLYYRFAKYISVVFVIGVIMLTLAWAFPDESVPGLAGRFSWLIIITCALVYLPFLVVEGEANKLLEVRRQLEAKEADQRLLLNIGDRLAAAQDLRRISRLGLAATVGAVRALKGFLAVTPDSGEVMVTATWHESRDRALEIARYAAEHGSPADAGTGKPCTVPGPGWKHPLIITLPGKGGGLAGLMMVDPATGPITDRQRNLVAVIARSVAVFLQKEILREQLEHLSIVDSMTALYNHRYFCERAPGEISRARRFALPLAVMISDIDNFKNHVDAHGHLKGDETIRKVGLTVKECLRKSDVIGRWGGDEFAYILPQTSKDGARVVAVKIQQALARKRFAGDGDPLTLSFGVASFPEDGNDWEGLLEKADKALFRAKEQGKNRVCLAGGEEH